MTDPHLEAAARQALEELRAHLPRATARARLAHVGRVVSAADGVAVVAGVERAALGELLDLDGVPARVERLDARGQARVVLLGRAEDVGAGGPARRLGRLLDVPPGEELLGRVVDPFGRPLDGGAAPGARRRVAVDGPTLPLTDRGPVTRPLRTGVFSLDTMVPIARGQRQLIVGDRSTGKTALAIDVLCAQGPDVVCVYVAIGRRGAEVATVIERLRRAGALEHGFVVVAEADDPPGLIHLAPYAATAMAEDLARAGRDALIVYDDLTAHADVHRALALLLGRPVGREAFPSDVFHAHARLLERAAQFVPARGGGSITALPLVETQAGDLAAYLPTNLVSITDGQVRLDAALHAAGQLPAVDVGLSVSRVGGRAQPPGLRAVAGRLKNDYAQFLELEVFSRLGSRLEPAAQRRIDWGVRAREALRQRRDERFGWAETIVRVQLLETLGVLGVPPAVMGEALAAACAAVRAADPVAWARLEAGETLAPARLDGLLASAGPAVARFAAAPEAGA